MTFKYYTGVGSRDVSEEEWNLMVGIGKWLANKGYWLRSGKAEGSDSAFEFGVSQSDNINNKEIYIPWSTFKGNQLEGEVIVLSGPTTDNFAISSDWVRRIHKYPDGLKQGAFKLHQRNIHQVLGKDLTNPNPSTFLLACADLEKDLETPTGGTRTAWVLAKQFGVPCLNVRDKTKKEIFDWLKQFVDV